MLKLIPLLMLALFACSNRRDYKISFCTNLSSEIECEPSLNTFNPGDRVYVLFECDQPFQEISVTGKFYYVDNARKIELGTQNWDISPGDSYAYDYVDFTEEGVYEFEFLNENGLVLAKNRLKIK